MPLFHIHGLIGVLLSSLCSGASVVCSPGFQAFSLFEWMDTFRPTWYSAVPTMHQAILEHAGDHLEIIDCCPLRFIRSSSSAIPPQVVKELENIFKTPVIEAYGMTEASHQMASNPLPPKQRRPGSVGIAAGPEVQIMNKAGDLLAPGEVGEIVIRGANVTPGYHNDTTANIRAFTKGWFRTGDLGRIDGDGYIFIDGRIKEIINRGGEKISPREIDEALLNHPDIRQAVTFAVKHPTLGEDVAAAVILKKNVLLSEQQIREFAFECLADFKVPSQVVIVETIPTGTTGKLQRIGLADKLAAQLKREFVAPAKELEKAVAKIFTNVLDTSPVGLYDNFFALGGDSLRGTQLISRIRSSFMIELPVTALFRRPTVIELSAEIVRLKSDCETASLTDIIDEIEELSEEDAARLLAEELGQKT
jgi:acyl-CoA synthetase (AMP-forming)/AMP-acid ligase II/acyl carrier protein